MESRARLSADIKAVWTCRPRNWRSGQQDGASEKYLVLEAALHRDLSLRTALHRAPSQDGRAVAEPDRAARPSVARDPGWPVFRADSPPCGQCDGAAHL